MDIKYKTSEINSSGSQVADCGICGENKAKYSCPRCNMPYCGLECYRHAEKHQTCSEDFYRDQVVEELKACTLRDDNESKLAMADILKRHVEELEQDTPSIIQEEDKEIDEKDLINAYLNELSKWSPWWRKRPIRLVSEVDSKSDIRLNDRLVQHANSIDTSSANTAIIFNDILLVGYSYLVLAFIYQLEIEDKDESVREEMVLNFKLFDKLIINGTPESKQLGLKSRLRTSIDLLITQNHFIRDYVNRRFLIEILEELEYISDRSDIQLELLSHLYSLLQFSCRKTANENELEPAINVFHLNQQVVKKKPEAETSKTRVKILTPVNKRISSETTSPVDLIKPGSSVKESKLLMKRVEFYFQVLRQNLSKMKSAGYREEIGCLRQEMKAELDDFEQDKTLIESNLSKLRSGLNKNKLIEEL